MPIDITVPGSPGWWIARLSKKLQDRERRNRLSLLNDWFIGEPPLPVGAENARDAYKAFQRHARSNFAELVVEAVRERIQPVGVRTSADSDATGDAEAWRIWRRAGLVVESAEVHRTMLALGDAYVIVGPPAEGSTVPVITAEDPRQVATEHDPRQQRRVVAGLKMFRDDVAERDLAYLYLPGRVYVAFREARSSRQTPLFSAQAWDWDETRGGEAGQPLPAGMMPVVRFRNARGVGEFETHLDLLARINHMILQRMVIATMQAFRQRAIQGDLPEHDEQGNPIDYNSIFVADPAALWLIPETAKIWESGQVDLTPILSSVRDDVEHLAAVTRTPMHMLAPGGENQSAEGAALSREGLVFKAEDRIARVEDGWAQVMSLAFRWLGDEARADLDTLDVMFAPAERYSLAERYDAGSKAQVAGVPWRTVMTDVLGFAPSEVDRMASERADDLLLASAMTALAAAQAPAAPVAGQ